MKHAVSFRRLQALLLLFYAAMMIFPVATCAVAYTQSLRLITDQEMATQTELTVMRLNQLELSLKKADQYTYSLMSLRAFENWFRSSREPQNKLVERMNYFLKNYSVFQDEAFSSYYIYSASNESIVKTPGGYLELPLHYENAFTLNGFDYQRWHDTILGDSSIYSFFSIPGETEPTLLYTRRIAYGNKYGRIIFYLNPHQLKEMFDRYQKEENSSNLFLYQQDGSLLYSSIGTASGDTPGFLGVFDGYRPVTLQGETKIVCAAPLNNYGLILYSATPRSYFSQSAWQLSQGILLRLLPLMVGGTALAALLMTTIHKPIRQTIRHLPHAPATSLNPFRYIQQQVDLLARINQEQEEQLRLSRGDLREAVLSAFVYQKPLSNFPLQEKIKELGIDLEGEHYRALILTLFSTEDGTPKEITDQMHYLILSIAQNYAEVLRYLKMDGPEQMLYLAVLDGEPDRTETLQTLLKQFCRDLSQALSMEPRISVGQECDDLRQVSTSFKTARRQLASRPSGEEYLLFPQPKAAPIYDYHSEDAKLLTQLVSVGNQEALHKALQGLYERNSGRNRRTDFEKQLLCARMIDTLIDAGYQGQLEDEMIHSLSEIPLERFFDIMEKHYGELCQQNRHLEKKAQDQRVTEILNEIQARYGEYELNLSSLALQFGLSDRRLTALIREQTGCSFSDYLEKVRIEQAVGMLRSQNSTIEEVALAVGYSNSKSFRRAFKRRTGQLPSAMR